MKTIATLVLVALISLAPSVGLAQQAASNPPLPRAESDRLRQDLLVLLEDVRAASVVLSAQSSYDDFMFKIGRIEKRLSAIRSKYRTALSRGDQKALGVPISDACAALYAAAGDWKQVRFAANEVTGAQRSLAHAAPWEVDFYQGQLRAAQVKHTEARMRLSDHTGTAVASVQAARRAQETSKKQAGAA